MLNGVTFVYTLAPAGNTTDIRRCDMEILKVILTSVLSAGALFVIAKVLGHKQMSQLDFFDYITGITIGSIAAEMATELEKPWKPLIAMIIYGGITWGLTLITSKLPKMRKYINGSPTIIMNGGKIYRKNMKKCKMDLSEFMVMCRQEGYFNLDDIQTVVFEYNGRLTVLPKSIKRPAKPEDLNIVPPPEAISTEVIMDGRILDENLKRMGLNAAWLKKEIKSMGYKNEKEILLGLCDDDRKLTLYKMT
ncbi:MAG: DUF421 domain-containing protein [Clostridia bacterium]|nr:DUF421 domain-containing protein [Clostridia bacterium]